MRYVAMRPCGSPETGSSVRHATSPQGLPGYSSRYTSSSFLRRRFGLCQPPAGVRPRSTHVEGVRNMGYLLSLQTLERANAELADAQFASNFSTSLCRSTFSTVC